MRINWIYLQLTKKNSVWMGGTFHIILLVPHNTIMDLTYVMKITTGWTWKTLGFRPIIPKILPQCIHFFFFKWGQGGWEDMLWVVSGEIVGHNQSKFPSCFHLQLVTCGDLVKGIFFHRFLYRWYVLDYFPEALNTNAACVVLLFKLAPPVHM